MTDTPLLELRGVSKHFGAVIALHEVDFKVYPGCVTALVGDNGAGKSTLIKCVAGIYRIDGGEVLYDGQPVNISGPRAAVRPRHRGRLPGPRAGRQPRRRPEHVPRARGARAAAHARRDQDGGSRARHAGEPVGHDDPQRAPDRRRPVRRSAPVGGGRQGRDVELAPGDPRRADRRARRRPDAPGARPRQAPRRAGARRGADLAQPARHLRSGGQHHRAAPRPERGRVQAHRGDAGAGGARDHGREADQGARRRRHPEEEVVA